MRDRLAGLKGLATLQTLAIVAVLFVSTALLVNSCDQKTTEQTANDAKTQGNRTLACLTSPTASSRGPQRCLNLQAAKNGQPGRTGAPGPRGARGPVGQPGPPGPEGPQ